MAGPPIDDKVGEDGGGGGLQSQVGRVEARAVKEQGGGGVQSRVDRVEVQATEEQGGGGGGAGSGGEEDEEVRVIGETRYGDAVEEDEREEEDDDVKVMSKIQALCIVLGSNYKEKLDEIGIVSGEKINAATRARMITALRFLASAKEDRFKKIKESAETLWNTWKNSEQPTERLLKVYQMFYILSADSPDKIREDKYLSVALLKKIEKETKSIQSSDLSLVKDKYERKKKKLLQLLKELHLTVSDLDFDPKKKIDAVNYLQEIDKLRGFINKLKEGRMTRMKLVLKMELIEKARKEKLSVEKLREFIEYARDFVEREEENGETIYYNGRNVHDVINAFEPTLTSSRIDSSDNSKSSRSVRLAARLKKAATVPYPSDEAS